MFYALSKILDLLLAPLTWGLVLLGGSVVARRTRAAPWLAAAAGVTLWTFSVEPVSVALARAAEASAPRTFRPGTTYDAVIVLGGGIDPGASAVSGVPELGPAGDRYVAGYELLRADRARTAILSGGGSDPGEVQEAQWGARLYERLGIPADRIVVEPDSRNTRENAVNTARIVRERGYRSLLLVTSALHAPRALGAFRAAGLSPDVLPVDFRAVARPSSWLPRASALERSTEVIREVWGRLVYRVMGYARS